MDTKIFNELTEELDKMWQQLWKDNRLPTQHQFRRLH